MGFGGNQAESGFGLVSSCPDAYARPAVGGTHIHTNLHQLIFENQEVLGGGSF